MNSLFISVFTTHMSFVQAAQIAHWNVAGRNFYEYHLLFQKVYEMLSSHTDELAEQARGERIEIPSRVFSDTPEMEWATGEDLVQWLLRLCMKYRADFDLLRDTLEQEKNFGFVNVVEGVLTDCNTIHYLLSSTLDIL